MGFSFAILSATLVLTLALVNCHHGDNQNHHNDDKWIHFVSQIHSFWKSDTSVKPTVTEINSESPLFTKAFQKIENSQEVYRPQPTGNLEAQDYSYIQNGTTFEDAKQGFKMSLAAIISIPVVGIIVLCCCCYYICKCCCGMCASQDKIVVMNPTVMQAPPPANPQPTQIIVQQPIYQNIPPPHQEMQYFPVQNQQWGQQPPQFQQPLPPQYFPKDGIDNPNFYPATAPLHYSQEKY